MTSRFRVAAVCTLILGWATAVACGDGSAGGVGTTVAMGSSTATTGRASSGTGSTSTSRAGTGTSGSSASGATSVAPDGNPVPGSQGPLCGAVDGQGGTACAYGQTCCEFYVDGGFAPQCTSPAACPADGGATFSLTCTGKASCPSGMFCCEHLGLGTDTAECDTDQNCSGLGRACLSNADCDVDGASVCEYYGPYGPGACY